MYRVSSKTVSTFVFWISRLPRALKIPSWTFFNSPFCVDLKKSNFLLFGELWTDIFAKYYREVILKVNIFRLLLYQPCQHSWALIISCECSLTHINNHERSWALMSLVLLRPLCPRPPGALPITAVELSWVLIDSWDRAHKCSWLLLVAFECPDVLKGAHDGSQFLMSTHGLPWTLTSLASWCNEHLWELKNNHAYSAMRSYALISTHERSWHHNTPLMSVHRWSWVLMSIYMRAHE